MSFFPSGPMTNAAKDLPGTQTQQDTKSHAPGVISLSYLRGSDHRFAHG